MTDVDVRSPGSVDSAEHKRKHIVWNEDNLSYNEANKSVSASPRPPDPAAPIRAPAPTLPHAAIRAVHDPSVLRTQAKMKIDEPDTPWASPPKELFEDPAEQENDVAMDDVAERLKHIEGPRAGDGSRPSGGADAAPPDASISAKKDDEWESSDDEGEGGSKGGRVALDPGALSDPTTGGGSDENDDDIIDEGPLDEYDRMLRARLFEAQRKSHQCTFRGVMAKGRALLEEEDDEEGE
jgi:hypothetical protein